MRHPLLRPFCLASLTLSVLASTSACNLDEDEPEVAFRSGLDVNIQLTQADGGEEDGTILWEIVEVDVFEGLAINGQVGLVVIDDVVYTAGGEQTCAINAPELNSTVREVIAANGTDVLFTVWGPYVLEGSIDPSINTIGKLRKLFPSQLLFEFDANEIYLGEHRDGLRLLTSSADVESSSDGRKLLIAALITGECGTAGMPGYTF